jgi:hypothetical protein
MLPLRNETVKIIRTVVVKLVSDQRQIGGFSPGTPVSSTNKTGFSRKCYIFEYGHSGYEIKTQIS